MKTINLTVTTLLSVLLLSCGSDNKAPEQSTPTKDSVAANAAPELNLDSLVSVVDASRKDIETNAKDSLAVPTTGMREKIKQKWEKVHYYTINGQVVRIKTYPYAAISKRTEEFYFNNGALILAVVEDDGSGGRGKANEELDKMYYYNNGKVIKERRKDGEQEYSVKESDGEELLAEAAEYLSAYPKK